MSHVDEGRLHAYLDGLERNDLADSERRDIERHLTECADCRTRLAEARLLRERASSLLDVAAPASTPLPPFADVLARAGGRERRRRIVRMNRLTALGWAATVVLAVGVGWIARGTMGFDGTPPGRQRAEQLADEAVPSTSAETPDVSVAANVAEPEQPSIITAEPEEAREDAIQARRQRAPAAAPAAEPQVQERDIAQAAAEEMVPSEAAAKGIGAAGRAAEAEADPSDSAAREQGARDAFAQGVVAHEAVAISEGLAVRTDADVTVPPIEWVSSDSAAAAVHLARPIHRIPGLPIESVETGSLFGQPAARLVQRSDSVTIELIQVPETVLANLVRDLGADERRQGRAASTTLSATVVVRNGTTVILRAALPPDSLRLLASRIP